ncbi:MAG: hypothetical protein ACOH13_01735 [Flavobacteriales bacterium]
MNNNSLLLVRTLVILTVLLFATPLWAQQSDPLSEGIKHLSPKERSALAAKETAQAKSDSAYQEVMRQAETAFREARYEDALSAYEEARRTRPYNVYPKVKIQDLQALLKKRDEAESGMQTGGEGPAPALPVTLPALPETFEQPVAIPTSPLHTPLKPVERVYMEGGAVVTERAVEEDGKSVIYKRVVQRSGQVFHFRDHLPIPAQVWLERFR